MWDIDKERAATTYKREALERLFNMKSAENPDARNPRGPTYACAECENPVASGEDLLEVEGQHKHTLKSSRGPVEVVTFSAASGTFDTGDAGAVLPEWEKPRPALGCSCKNCRASLGWSYRGQQGDEKDFKALHLSCVKIIN